MNIASSIQKVTEEILCKILSSLKKNIKLASCVLPVVLLKIVWQMEY